MNAASDTTELACINAHQRSSLNVGSPCIRLTLARKCCRCAGPHRGGRTGRSRFRDGQPITFLSTHARPSDNRSHRRPGRAVVVPCRRGIGHGTRVEPCRRTIADRISDADESPPGQTSSPSFARAIAGPVRGRRRNPCARLVGTVDPLLPVGTAAAGAIREHGREPGSIRLGARSPNGVIVTAADCRSAESRRAGHPSGARRHMATSAMDEGRVAVRLRRSGKRTASGLRARRVDGRGAHRLRARRTSSGQSLAGTADTHAGRLLGRRDGRFVRRWHT